MLAFLNNLSPWHLLLLAAVALLFYGNRLPEVARSLGRAVNEFKRLKDVTDEIERDEPAPPPRPQRLEPPAGTERLPSGAADQPGDRRVETRQEEAAGPPPS